MSIALAMAATLGQTVILATPVGDHRDWITIKDLPQDAPQDFSASIGYRLLVSETGEVEGCETTGNSFAKGGDLDRYGALTCKLLRARAKFEIGRAAGGFPAKSIFVASQPWSHKVLGPQIVRVMPSHDAWPKNPDGKAKTLAVSDMSALVDKTGAFRMVLAEPEFHTRILGPTADNNYLRTQKDIKETIAAGQRTQADHAALLSRKPKPINSLKSWFAGIRYPPGADSRGEGGEVHFALTIDRLGSVTGCDIINSSGSLDLDQTTCAVFLTRAKFVPGLNELGQPVNDKYYSRVRWVWTSPQQKQIDLPSYNSMPPPPPPLSLPVDHKRRGN